MHCDPVYLTDPDDLKRDAPQLAKALLDYSDANGPPDGLDGLPTLDELDGLPTHDPFFEACASDDDPLLEVDDDDNITARIPTMPPLNVLPEAALLGSLPTLDDLPKLDSIDAVLDFEEQREQAWVDLQKTWQFDRCFLPAEYAAQADKGDSPRIPSLFVFVSTLSNLLANAGRITQAVSANKLFAGYLAQTISNLPATEYIAHAFWLQRTPGSYTLTIKDGRLFLKLECRMPDGTIQRHSFDPMSVFNALQFRLGESFATTPAFSAQFLNGQIQVIYGCNIVRTPVDPIFPKTIEESQRRGTSFDTHFPAIAQPPALAAQFSPGCAHAPVSINAGKLYMGFLAFSVGLARPATEKLQRVWAPMLPKMMLCAGTFTNPAFPPTLKLPGEPHVNFMWTLFTTMATRQDGTPNGQLLGRALRAAQKVRDYYGSGQEHLMRLKMLCVAWRVLQHALVKSPTLFQIMLRSFCYASSHRLDWHCRQEKISHIQLDLPPLYPARCQPTVSAVTAWNLTTSCFLDARTARQPPGMADIWWFVCPFTVYDKCLTAVPTMDLGRAFKIQVT